MSERITKERPILFSAPMVRAILAGTKTQTRRLLGAELPYDAPMSFGVQQTHSGRWGFFDSDGEEHVCRYGKPGDRLWVRETFYCDHCEYPRADVHEMQTMLEYRADHRCDNWEAGCPCRDEHGRSSWRPSIHMPRWASRIDLEITGVRVERLQSLSVADVLAEGITGPHYVGYMAYRVPGDSKPRYSEAAAAFETLWDSINAERAPWASNPWVWVLEFKRVGGA